MLDMWSSPYIVPVGACAMALGIVIAAKVAEVKKRQMEYEERMAALAKGLPLPPLESEARYAGTQKMWESMSVNPGQQPAQLMYQPRTLPRTGAIRRGGIVLIAVAAGLALFFITLSFVLGVREILAGAASALIPFAIGVGLLIDSTITTREHEQAKAEAAELALRH